MKRLMVLCVGGVMLTSLLSGSALAVHEANNKFDMRAVTVELPSADATGISSFAAGSNGWSNEVSATGLDPNTTYTWVGIAQGTASTICSFTTDATGSGSCTSDVNSRLGATEIRTGDQNGTPVLRADASTDDDNKVEDGEIERRGTKRLR